MPGLLGGSVDERTLQEMASRTYQRDFHEVELLSDVGLGLVHHGEKDPQGANVVQTDDAVGVVYGLTPEFDGWVDRVLDSPDVVSEFDGPFSLACADRTSDRYVIATDKMGTRTAYFTNDETFAFGSELTSVLPMVSDVALNPQAVSDMVYMAHVWGSKTLVEDVYTLPPATVAVHEGGDLSISRYWDPSFGTTSEDGYVTEVATTYQEVMDEMSSSVDGRLGLWLSGGLDSRTMAMALDSTHNDFETFTYNRPLGKQTSLFKSDIGLAKDVSALLGVNNTTIQLTAEKLTTRLEDLVAMTDGMVGWHTLINLSAIFDINPAAVDVILEGSGASILCGEKVPAEALQTDREPEDELYQLLERVDGETVQSALAPDVDPAQTFRDAVRRSNQTTTADQILGSAQRNYYIGKHFMSNKVSRGFFGTRVPFSHERLLTPLFQMPPRYRRQTVPLTDGKIPVVPSLMKLELVRWFGDGAEQIPYEATQLRPTKPHWMHSSAFLGKQAYQRLLSRRVINEWYDSNDQFREIFDQSLDRAAALPVFDADAIDRLREEHTQGEQDHIEALASISTVDLFVEVVLEDSMDLFQVA